VIVDTTLKMGLTPEDDFILRVVQLSELLAIRHCVFLMGPTGSGRSECFKVLAKAIQTGTDKPVNTYLEACNRKKVRLTATFYLPILQFSGKLVCTTAAEFCLVTYGLAITF
jgi:energy-coupling factor transporter ATP-binding protein EcfA2